jgi:hypothetical protein
VALDLDQLRRQYESLTDEALLEVDRTELVEAAQQCYDDEVLQRGLSAKRPIGVAATDEDFVFTPDEGEPDWLEDGMSAMSMAEGRGGSSVLDARDVLRRANVACYILVREPEEQGSPSIYDLLVPPGQHLLALSVLDRDFFNPRMEEDWKAHFSVLSDDELMDMDADVLVAGMRDRIDRLVRAYEDELLKRGLAELETEPPR